MISNGTSWNMNKIQKIMNKKGITRGEVAAKLNTSRQLISYYFNSTPTMYKVLRVAKALSIKDWKELIA